MVSKDFLLGTLTRLNKMMEQVLRDDSPAVRAVRSDDIVDVQRFMQEGHRLSETDSQCNSLLHLAAIFRCVSVVDFLLTQDAIEINHRNDDGWTALFLAATLARCPPIVDKLLSAGADATLPYVTMLDYLLNCPGEPTPETVSVTLRLMESVPVEGDSLLHVAALSDPQLLSALIQNGADVNAHNYGGNTPLHVAVSLGSDASISMLLGAGADVNARNRFGSTPLHLAFDRDPSIARKLIAAGADLELKDGDGCTALHDAVRREKQPMVKLLVEAGAGLDCRSLRDETPLHLAMANLTNGGLRLALLLVERGADVDAEDYEGNTPLHVAAKRGNLEGAAMLLYHGAEPNRTNRDGCTPFMAAIDTEQEEVQELLLEYETDFNRETKSGESLVALATRCQSPFLWEIIDRGGEGEPIDTTPENYGDTSYKSAEYEMILRQTGYENFPVGEYDTLLGFTSQKFLPDLFRYVVESGSLPAILDDAYERRSQGLLTIHNNRQRGDHHPAIDGILEFVLEYFFDFEEAVELTYILLSYGYEPDYLEVYQFFNQHGRCPIVDFLLDMDLRPHIIPKDRLLLTIILDPTHSVRKHINNFSNLELTSGLLQLNMTTILPYVTNADLFHLFKERLCKCGTDFEVPHGLDRSVPSLQELSRDRVRDSVCAKGHITTYNHFCKNIKSLRAGALWKLITFREPLY